MIIGITGGVGAGKSTVMAYLKQEYNVYTILADDVAKELQTPGHDVYKKMIDLLGTECVLDNGQLNRQLVAKKMFQNKELLHTINAIVHPAVKEEILSRITDAKKNYQHIAIEAALLIESHYEDICDEFWYIDVSDAVRIQRLQENRGYSPEKSADIMKRQLSREEFSNACQRKIDNSGSTEDLKKQLDNIFQKTM